MDPDRKRKIRLGVALGTAVLLAAALVYTSFSASTEAKQPSDLLTASSGGTYDLTGKVVADSVRRSDDGLRFEIEDRDGSASLPVAYTGAVPDPFREGREVIVTGEMENGTFVAERDSLVTKCPSKFSDEAEEDPEHVIIDE
ncbi:MAG TPA: cytochrome c maturation protein CcmE [Solirubrobacterales bacterium]|jgi:cytochrome c-type biogenesis protein CcmE|nr:cytochrome c maturation protein CcmE [Solirubrobacterales bacterium]